jgi:hypothetical protein
VKNLFGILDVYLQVLLTRLTLVDNTRLFLKPSNYNKIILNAFHSLQQRTYILHDKESVREMHESVDELDSSLPLPTDGCCQPTATTGDKSVATFSMLGPKSIIGCESISISQD